MVQNRGHMGIYFDRKLALKFAAWLSPEFEVWVFSTLDEIIFGNYKKHWQAHVAQEDLKRELGQLKKSLLADPTSEMAYQYFAIEDKINSLGKLKRKAIAEQMKLDLFKQGKTE